MRSQGGNVIFDPMQAESRAGVPASVRVQRTVLGHGPVPLRDLYWRGRRNNRPSLDAVRPDGAGALRIEAGATACFDTYFGALFEHHWRLHTRAASFALAVETEGRAMLRLWRATPHGGSVFLHEAEVDGTAEIVLPHDGANFRQAGMVWFDVTAADGPVLLRRADWWAMADAAADPVGLAVVICTFNREPELGRVLASIADDPALVGDEGAVARVIVVSQGRRGLLAHPGIAPAAARLGERLRVVEQGNFGGAGGFGRGLLEALDDPDVTHAAFVDDDVRLEPESLLRMAAFFALARGDKCLGGHMLDSIRPTTLYEGGAVVQDNWVLRPLSHNRDLRPRQALVGLLDTPPMDYNGWWCFGFPKRLAVQHGMPLPCFIRGDDVEWGRRLHDGGVPTVSLPGVGIWHEPFYLKIGSWQLYYETRNALICAALHMDFRPRHVAVQIFKRLLIYLLTFRYYSAALIVRAAEDFLRGPAILDADPQGLHASLSELRTRHPEGTISRETVLRDAPVAGSPWGRLGFAAALGAIVLRNWLRATPAPGVRPRRVLLKDLVWFRVWRSDALAVETYWDQALPVFRRNRTQFRALLRTGLRAVRALHAAAPGLRAAWQAEAPRMTSVPHWRAYLKLPGAADANAGGVDTLPDPAPPRALPPARPAALAQPTQAAASAG